MKTTFATVFLITYLSFLLKPFLPEIEYKVENDLCSPELVPSDVCSHNHVSDLRNNNLCYFDALKSRVNTNKYNANKKATPTTQIQNANIIHVSNQKYFLPKSLDAQSRKFSDLSFIIQDITLDILTPPPKC
ncbi:MAG: hypothetical protein GY936_18065 [Ignavibacteriae bacterium]|nr:hypothetical protein [Ignavibacteriota bacterium]